MTRDPEQLWYAVFGAAFTRQMIDRQRDGYGDQIEMVSSFYEEAECIADLAVEEWMKAQGESSDR